MSQSTVNQTSFSLVVAHENGSRTEHPLQSGCSMFIGSSRNCGIHVPGTDVAAKHCLVDLNDDVVSIQDWVSPTGTIVNGAAIDSKVAISESDNVKLGNTTITVQTKTAPPADVETPSELTADATVGENSDAFASEHDLVVEGEDQEQASLDLDFDQSLDTLDSVSELLGSEADSDSDLDSDGWNDEGFDEDAAWNTMPDDDDLDDAPSPAVSWSDQADDYETDDFAQYDQQTVDLLKAEIDDLRSMLADRDLHIQELSADPVPDLDKSAPVDDLTTARLQARVDELLVEASEHDERIAILQDLLQVSEVKINAEAEERQALESWLGEIEQRIGERESEWNAELDALKQRVETTTQERDQLQHKLRQVASRFDAADAYQDTLDKLQARNAKLQEQFESARKQCVSLKKHVDHLKNKENDALQEERAVIAKERAAVSRMRFELSRKLNEFESASEQEPQNLADKEVALRLQTLRSHLREIHEQEQEERAQKGESLISRISSLWKRMDYEY